MSNTMHIQFAHDMPVVAVDVVAPDLQILKRLMMMPGGSRDVPVRDEGTFLRVHMPSGEIVTLERVDVLRRTIHRADVEPPTSSAKAVRTELADPADTTEPVTIVPDAPLFSPLALGLVFEQDDVLYAGLDTGAVDDDERRRSAPMRRRTEREPRYAKPPLRAQDEVPITPKATVRIEGSTDGVSVSKSRGVAYEWDPRLPCTDRPSMLQLRAAGSTFINVMLPASVRSARVQWTGRSGAKRLSVRLRTQSAFADAIVGYVGRGDLYAAGSMLEWAEQAEQLVLDDDRDPYSALVGAYLLLRMRRFDAMREWVKGVAEQYTFLPDACIIWAWQLVHTRRGAESEARNYFFEACRRPLPVYSEGLRLLMDGLCLYGEEGDTLRRELMKRCEDVVTGPPLLSHMRIAEGAAQVTPIVDILFPG